MLTALAPDDVAVTAHLVIEDERQRAWQVRWDGHGAVEEVVPSSTEYQSDTLHTFGDLDDGDRHRVALRPVGGTDWCRATGHLR